MSEKTKEEVIDEFVGKLKAMSANVHHSPHNGSKSKEFVVLCKKCGSDNVGLLTEGPGCDTCGDNGSYTLKCECGNAEVTYA